MREQIRAAFEPIRAEEEMQARTRAFLHERLYRHAAPRARRAAQALRVAVCAFVLLLGVGGYASYATAVATISMDINPSLELSVNRYGRVIGVQGYNEDGRAVAAAVTVKHLAYADAIETILREETVAACLAEGQLLEITVVNGSEDGLRQMQNCILERTGIAPEQLHCTQRQADVAEAHAAGLSVGKYRAYLELREVLPDVTVEDVQRLTMREIRDLLEQAGQGGDGVGGRGPGFGHGNGYGAGSGNGNAR